MKTKLMTFLAVIFVVTGYSQTKLVYSYTEESEKLNHTYRIVVSYDPTPTLVNVNIKGYEGIGETINSEAFSEFEIILKATSNKEIKNDSSMRLYRLKATYDSLKSIKDSDITSDMSKYMLVWSMISKFNVTRSIMLASFGDDTILLKRKI